MNDAQVIKLTSPFDSSKTECDGMTRILHTVLSDSRIQHVVKIGRVEWNGKHFSPHFWIELPNGKVVDYRLKMWFGHSAPHGVFDPEKMGVVYEGREASIPVLTDFLFGILAGRSRNKTASDVLEIRKIAESARRKLGASSLQCCRFATELCKMLRDAGFDAKHIYGHVLVDGNYDGVQWGEGPVSWYKDDKTVERWMDHHWVEIDGMIVDIAADQFNPLIEGRGFDPVFIGKSNRHKKQLVVCVEGTLGKPMEAGLKEVIDKITKRIRDSEIAKRLTEKVMRYVQTRNPDDDLTPAEVSAIYRGEDYGDDFDMPAGVELDVGWTNHAEYRSDLRGIDPSKVNEAVRDFAETHPHKHQKVNLINHNIGKAVVDVNTMSNPEEAHVVTVIASGNDLKSKIVDRADKVKSPKVKKYVHDGMLRKIDQAGDSAAIWLEKLESDFKKLKPEGLMKGFEEEDFDDLWFVVTGEKRGKEKKASDDTEIENALRHAAGLIGGSVVVSRGESFGGFRSYTLSVKDDSGREWQIVLSKDFEGVSIGVLRDGVLLDDKTIRNRWVMKDGQKQMMSIPPFGIKVESEKMVRKFLASSDVILMPGAGDGSDDTDQTHNYKLGKIADRVASGFVASKSRHCSFFKASNGKWYLNLADEEYAGYEDATTYGPFDSFEDADRFLDQFSNPGGYNIDDRGVKPVPMRSPNGLPVQKPTWRGRGAYA